MREPLRGPVLLGLVGTVFQLPLYCLETMIFIGQGGLRDTFTFAEA